jgi:predicted nucleic acid-binding protein
LQRLFFDINVILDILTAREPHYAAWARVYRMVEENIFTGLISILSLSTIHYILMGNCTHSEAVRLVRLLRDILEIVDAPAQTANLAMDSEWPDFEDALPYFAAVHGQADCIITRNPSDFRKSKLPVYTPEEFLELREFQSSH